MSRAASSCLLLARRRQCLPVAAKQSWSLYVQHRGLAGKQRAPDTFIGKLVENVKAELKKSGEIKENVGKLQENVERLQEKGVSEGKRFSKFFSGLRPNVSEDVTKSAKEKVEQVSKIFSGFHRPTISEDVTKSAKEKVEKVSKGIGAVTGEIMGEGEKLSRPYTAPKEYRRRVPQEKSTKDQTIEEDTESTGIELHKDARFYNQWTNFKNNNQFINGLFDLKRRYDESDSLAARSFRTVTDKLSSVFAGMTTPSELSQVLDAIIKVDSTFDQEKFIAECQLEIIPTVLEAFLRGEEDVLRDWCHDAAFGVLSTLLEQHKQMGWKSESRILDIGSVDLLAGKMMEQGPVLIIAFQAQQLMLIRDQQGEIVEGGEDYIERYQYVWALCRDQSIFDPQAAWRILEFAISSSNDQFV